MAEVDPASTHKWVVAATMAIPYGIAKAAERRGTYKLPQEMKVSVQEIYCEGCRRPYSRVAATPCVAKSKDQREHLIGGPVGERRKRDDGGLAATG